MRHDESRLVNHEIVVEQQIEIERARTVADGSHPGVLVLDPEKLLQQRFSRKLGLEARGAGWDRAPLDPP